MCFTQMCQAEIQYSCKVGDQLDLALVGRWKMSSKMTEFYPDLVVGCAWLPVTALQCSLADPTNAPFLLI